MVKENKRLVQTNDFFVKYNHYDLRHLFVRFMAAAIFSRCVLNKGDPESQRVRTSLFSIFCGLK